MLETLGIHYRRADSIADLGDVCAAIDHAFNPSALVAVVVGTYTGWL